MPRHYSPFKVQNPSAMQQAYNYKQSGISLSKRKNSDYSNNATSQNNTFAIIAKEEENYQ